MKMKNCQKPSKNIVKWPIKRFLKQCIVDGIVILISISSTFWIKLNSCSYFSWFLMACKVGIIILVISVLVNLVFYKKELVGFAKYILGIIFRKKRKC